MKSITNALFIIAVLFFNFSQAVWATDRVINKELIIGHVLLDHPVAVSESAVADAAEKLSAFDANFSSMAVVGVNEKEFGIYFYYRKNPKCKTEKDFEKLLKSQGYNSWSYSDNVIVIK